MLSLFADAFYRAACNICVCGIGYPMGPGCESGSRFFCRRLSRIMDRMDKTIEHNEQAAQAEGAAVQAERVVRAEGAAGQANSAAAQAEVVAAKAVATQAGDVMAQAETAAVQAHSEAEQAKGATAYADAARASDAEGFNREDAERTLSLTASYNGGPFCGFARQPGKLTVQGELEQALSMVMRRPVEVVCSGRTDAGVHALGQVVSFNVSADELESRSLYSLRRSLNALTHEDITVRKVEEREPGFSARFDAQWREYHYHICLDDTPPLFMRDFSWFVHADLDVPAMQQAARYLEGEHDFKSFCMAASAVGKPTCRNVHEISLSRETIMGEEVLTIKVVGNAFLHSMVRTIVGTLVMVGRGLRKPEWVREVLEARDRTAAGENAPAAGLVFWKVQY